MTLVNANDTFVASWLAKRNLSNESEQVFKKGRDIYQMYFLNLGQIPNNIFKIETWDAGWWQIKQSLQEVTLCKNELSELKVLQNMLCAKILKGLIKSEIVDG